MSILRWDVPVDGSEHIVSTGRIVHVDCKTVEAVTFWAEDEGEAVRTFRVYGTGQTIPRRWAHVGTALSPEGDPGPRGTLVWHLFEQVSP